MIGRTRELVREEVARILPRLREYKAELTGKRAAIYTGGAFKAFSLDPGAADHRHGDRGRGLTDG